MSLDISKCNNCACILKFKLGDREPGFMVGYQVAGLDEIV